MGIKVDDFKAIGNLTIHKPDEWDVEHMVLIEIQDYTYDSTKINLHQLKLLHDYIGEILNEYSVK